MWDWQCDWRPSSPASSRSSRVFLQCLGDRLLGDHQHGITVVRAEYLKLQLQQPADAGTRARRLILVLTCNEGETLSTGIGEQVCAEDRASIPFQEKGVMGLSGAWCVDRQQVARQAVVGFVPTVRRFLEINTALRRVTQHMALTPIAPGLA